MRYPWWAILAGCSPPELSTARDRLLFEGGDGLSPSLERVLSGAITSDLTLDAAEPWILDGLVSVSEGATLTIEPGTTIYGNPSTRGTLVVSQGARLVADGTPAQPIVFTSPRARGARRAGDWGGIAIDGYAPVNGCLSQPCVLEGEGETGPYGGADADDDSGVLRYVRIEFAGALYTPEDELNGLALQGVGRGTVIDYVQLHVIADDGVEFFGGTVDARHVLVTGAGDDAFDWTNGWRGSAQYVIIQQHEGSGDRAIEADNNEEDHAAAPQSLPALGNLTAIGTSTTTGFVFRRGTGVHLSNSIVYAYATCIDVQDELTWQAAPRVAGTWLSCASPYGDSSYTDPESGLQTVEGLLTAESSGNVLGDPGLVDPTDPDSPDFRLAPGSPALQGAIAPIDAGLEATSFAGALDDQDDWTTGWTTAGTN
jgi:hypothetical protein